MLPPNFKDSHICVIGLGYVGLTLAVALADSGFTVHGVERDRRILAMLTKGAAHFSEVGLNNKLAEQIGSGRFTFSETIEFDPHTTVYIVTVGTPVGSNKRTQVEALSTVIEGVNRVLKESDLVILRSTVRVGTTRTIVQPILAQSGRNYDLAFCPERTLEGKAMSELRTLPQIVGGIDDASTFRASQMFSFLTPSVIRVRDVETAEMVKLINNTQRDYIFAFANEVAAMCDVLKISASEVIKAGNIGYPRANLPMPGPVGGPCLEKDPYILAEGFENQRFKPKLALAGRHWNESLPNWTIDAVAKEFRRVSKHPPAQIAILGLAFKGMPETDDLRGTLALPIIARLQQEFPSAKMIGWDALVPAANIKALGIQPVGELPEAFQGSSIVIIQNNHPVFESMNIVKLAGLMANPGLIYDYWNQHDPWNTKLPDSVFYHGLGTFGISTRGGGTEIKGRQA